MKKNNINIPFLTSVLVILVLLDQISKYLAFYYQVSTNGIFFLQISENRGSAFSMFSHISWYNEVIILLSFILFFYGIYYVYNHRKTIFLRELAILILFAAGLIGNLIDRIFYSYVRDFIGIKYYAIFNIADVYLFLAVALLIYLEVKKK